MVTLLDMTYPQLLSRRSLIARGHSDTSIRTAVGDGSLLRLAPGCFVRAAHYEGLDLDERYRLLVRAEASRSPGLIVSDVSAAALWDLPVPGSEHQQVHFVRCARGGQGISARRHVRSVSLGDVETTRRHGVLVTTPAQTVLDLARWSYESTAVVVGDAALQRGLVTPDMIVDRLPSVWNCKGAPSARLTLPRLDGRSESPGESRLRLAVEDGGLSGFVPQVVITDELGVFVARADLGHLSGGVLLEYDGLGKYTDQPHDALMREKRRRDRVAELRWLTVHVTADDLSDEPALLGRIDRALYRQRGVRTRGAATPLAPVRVAIPDELLPRTVGEDLALRRMRRRYDKAN